ncbi:MAG: hypothetical protein HYR88_11520, partial [Verrucomicrobia bacterium]|nr:hypothetical protein [Verrucomicrobiota bacterium]
MNAASRGLDPVQASALREAAARVAASPALAKSHRLAVLFNHLVEALIEGRADTLKEFSIAADVFGRDASFDPKTDSTVRTQTLRLRERLELYYAREGAADPIRIWLAKGSYVLRHEPRTESIAGPASLE